MANRLTILLICTHTDEMDRIQSFLSDTDIMLCDVVRAQTISKALAILDKQTINCILLILDGLDSEAYAMFHAMHQLHRYAPIVLLCREEDEAIAMNVIKSDVQGYLIKSHTDAHHLVRAIIHAIERNSSQQILNKYISILESISDAIISITLDGTIKTWNKAAEEVYGYMASEIIDQQVTMLFSPGTESEMDYVLQSIKIDGRIIAFEAKHMRKDQKLIDIRMTVSPIFINSSGLIGVSMVVHDITAQKIADRQLTARHHVSTILNKASDIQAAASPILKAIGDIFEWHVGVFWLLYEPMNAMRHVATWTDNAIYSDLEIEHKDMLIHQHDGMAGYVWKKKELYWTADITPISSAQTESLLKYNLKSTLEIPIVFQGKIFGVIQFFNDVIAKPDNRLSIILKNIGEMIGGYINRKHMEHQQRALQEELRIKNEKLQAQVYFIKQASRAKSTFLANMSHELRTPLNSVIGFAELIYKEKLGPLSPEHKDCLKEVLTNAHHLLHLINDILDLTKIEAGKMAFQLAPTYLPTLMKETINAMRLSFEEKKIHLASHIDPALKCTVMIDPNKLKQILFNYLSNAIKFTPIGGKVVVRMLPEDAQTFRLEVSDTGIGISKDDLGKLFEMFNQLSISYSKHYQGIGVGLALTRMIAEALGGRVGVVSELGKGSTFFAILPFIPSTIREKEVSTMRFRST